MQTDSTIHMVKVVNEPNGFAILIGEIRDIAVGLAAIATAVIATLGLKSWNQELVGKEKYRLGRRIQRNLNRIRAEVHRSLQPNGLAGFDEERIRSLEIRLDRLQEMCEDAGTIWPSKRIPANASTFVEHVQVLTKALRAVRSDGGKADTVNSFEMPADCAGFLTDLESKFKAVHRSVRFHLDM